VNRQDVVAAVREELLETVPDFPADADDHADLRADLGVDSLAVLEFVARLEYRFNRAVPDDVWPQLTSVAAIVDYLSDSNVPS
jgi:acyl carrier protein